MKTATQLFDFERRESSSAFIAETWRTSSVPDEEFISVATCGWEIAITRQDERAWLSVRGPETIASIAPIPAEAEFIGIRFAPGAFMPSLPPSELVDDVLDLPSDNGRSFWLNGSEWPLPSFDDVDALVDRLVHADLVVLDPVVARVMGAGQVDLGERSVQRRIVRAMGLSRRLMTQIERAQKAADMLLRGMSIGDVASDAGYTDQAHLTRSMRRFIGKTPAELRRSGHFV